MSGARKPISQAPDASSVPIMTMAVMNDIDRVRHAFFTRQGGVSEGLYAGLNTGYGSGDDRQKVTENRTRAAAVFGIAPENLVTVHQFHSADVVRVTEPWTPENAPKADAMVTNIPGILLGILTADCVPVLLADGKAGVIGAAHAGWKGAKAGVVQNTLAAMEDLGADRTRITAVIGPAIHQRSYEVGAEFREAFLDDAPENQSLFYPGRDAGKFLFDLRAFVGLVLGAAEVPVIDSVPGDTLTQSDRFYSYRRSTIRGEADYGRQLSAIALDR